MQTFRLAAIALTLATSLLLAACGSGEPSTPDQSAPAPLGSTDASVGAASADASTGSSAPCTFVSGRTCAAGAHCYADNGCSGCLCQDDQLLCGANDCLQTEDITCKAEHTEGCRSVPYYPGVCARRRGDSTPAMYYCPTSNECPKFACVSLNGIPGEDGAFWCCP